MTIPPRWSELEDSSFYKEANAELCITCVDPKHDQCSMTDGCSCCEDTRNKIFEEGNHNRFAANDTANDELYMSEDIGPIAGGIGAATDEPDGALRTSSWYMTADMLPDSMGAPDNSAPVDPTDTGTGADMMMDPSAASTQSDPNAQPMMQTASKETVACEICSDDIPHENRYDERPDMYICKDCNSDDHHDFENRYASTWRSEDYMATIQKQASDSDVYYQGYADATGGKQMDEGLANLSMDYYQGYKQGLLYNENNLQSAPAKIEDVAMQSYYPEKTNSAPYALDHNELRSMSDFPSGDYPKVGSSSDVKPHWFPKMGELMYIHRRAGDTPSEAIDKTLVQYPDTPTFDILKDYHHHLSGLMGNNPGEFEQGEHSDMSNILDDMKHSDRQASVKKK